MPNFPLGRRSIIHSPIMLFEDTHTGARFLLFKAFAVNTFASDDFKGNL